jgi:hypothetical protein
MCQELFKRLEVDPVVLIEGGDEGGHDAREFHGKSPMKEHKDKNACFAWLSLGSVRFLTDVLADRQSFSVRGRGVPSFGLEPFSNP